MSESRLVYGDELNRRKSAAAGAMAAMAEAATKQRPSVDTITAAPDVAEVGDTVAAPVEVEAVAEEVSVPEDEMRKPVGAITAELGPADVQAAESAGAVDPGDFHKPADAILAELQPEQARIEEDDEELERLTPQYLNARVRKILEKMKEHAGQGPDAGLKAAYLAYVKGEEDPRLHTFGRVMLRAKKISDEEKRLAVLEHRNAGGTW